MKVNDFFPSKYLKASDLQGRALRVIIDRIDIVDLGGEGKPGDTKPVVSLRDRKKQLVLNKTNAMTLANVLGDETDAWTGKEIEVYPATTSMQGRMVECIRVKLPAEPADFDDDVNF